MQKCRQSSCKNTDLPESRLLGAMVARGPPTAEKL